VSVREVISKNELKLTLQLGLFKGSLIKMIEGQQAACVYKMRARARAMWVWYEEVSKPRLA
jgi:hypothetical protein